MAMFDFNGGTLFIEDNDIRLEIPLKSLEGDLMEDDMDFITQLSSRISFPCSYEILEDTDKLAIHFQMDVNEGFVTLQKARLDLDLSRDIKMKIALGLIDIGKSFEEYTNLNTVIDPNNIFANPDGEVRVLYRGIRHVMPAQRYEEETVYKQVRRLVVFLLSSANFDQLRVQGDELAFKKADVEYRQIVKRISECEEGFEELTKIIGVALKPEDTLREAATEEMAPPKKKIYQILPTKKEEAREKKPKEKEAREKKIHKPKKVVKSDSPNIQRSWITKSMSLILTGTVVVSIGIGYVLGSSGSSPKAEKTNDSSTPLIQGLRSAGMQQYDEAARYFEKTDFAKLNKEDQKVVLLSYLLSGKEEKAIQLEPKFAESVVSYYISHNQLNKVKNLKTNLPVIQFEKAILEKDPKKIIELKGKVRLDGRREKVVLEAFLSQKDFEGAYDFARTTGNNDLIELIKKREEKKDSNATAGTSVS
ncbi:hypothetical protein J2Z48_002993 [Croceifilum oryzae]|uniref:Uncharacterized protein n=1 Tax=Croceifilum oryzae TaxID=1553429 RepID=A0AAJ1TM92_9BACL|nr:type VII secretion protein EssB/YukC [Croceifilum oryzae]MDQ0418789.1 hypothetical protein [Croceifilum oryzae]